MRLILASGSPRRSALLRAAGYPIEKICPAEIPERRAPRETPEDYTARLSREKARHRSEAGHWVLGADTVVHQGEDVLEKPQSDREARAMLTRLAGTWHRVTTSWCLAWRDDTGERLVEGQCTSRVRFRELLPAEIAAYVATGEGQDKAGSYGIQGLGATLVAEVEGSHSNVVGLPMEQLSRALQSVGVHPRGPQ